MLTLIDLPKKEPEPPKVIKYTITKYVEKEAFKRIEEDIINSDKLLDKIKVTKISQKAKEEKKQKDDKKDEDQKDQYFKQLQDSSTLVTKKIPWWSYKVYHYDHNYAQRTDRK